MDCAYVSMISDLRL